MRDMYLMPPSLGDEEELSPFDYSLPEESGGGICVTVLVRVGAAAEGHVSRRCEKEGLAAPDDPREIVDVIVMAPDLLPAPVDRDAPMVKNRSEHLGGVAADHHDVRDSRLSILAVVHGCAEVDLLPRFADERVWRKYSLDYGLCATIFPGELMRALLNARQPVQILEYSLHFHARVGCCPIQSLVTFEGGFSCLCGFHVAANLKDDWPVALDGQYQICVRKGNSRHEFLRHEFLQRLLGAAQDARKGRGVRTERFRVALLGGSARSARGRGRGSARSARSARGRGSARGSARSARGSARGSAAIGRIGLAVINHEVVEFIKLLLCQLHELSVKLQIDSLEPFVRVLEYSVILRL